MLLWLNTIRHKWQVPHFHVYWSKEYGIITGRKQNGKKGVEIEKGNFAHILLCISHLLASSFPFSFGVLYLLINTQVAVLNSECFLTFFLVCSLHISFSLKMPVLPRLSAQRVNVVANKKTYCEEYPLDIYEQEHELQLYACLGQHFYCMLRMFYYVKHFKRQNGYMYCDTKSQRKEKFTLH